MTSTTFFVTICIFLFEVDDTRGEGVHLQVGMDHLLDLLEGCKQKEICHHGKRNAIGDCFPSNAISHIIIWNPQEHLLIHLVKEVKLVGLVEAQWMDVFDKRY